MNLRVLLAPALGLSAAAVTALQSTDEVKSKSAQKIEAALPKEAPAKPTSPRKILVFTKTNGFRHSSIADGVFAMSRMGESTGAYAIVHTEDENLFSEDSLKNFDAVMFLNTTGDVFRPKDWPKDEAEKKAAKEKEKQLQQNLVEFVKGGKGLIGVHAATDTYQDWKEYAHMMGGTFNTHPWHQLVPVTNIDPKNPVNAAFEGKDFEINDEIYQMRDGTARPEDRRMLLSLDPSWKELAKGKRADNFWPIAWISRYGEGRVFYCSLGHREEIYGNPMVLKHYLAGIQFALGDLKTDATPIPLKK